MKTLILSCLVLSGCGLKSQTINEYCMEHLSRYKDYDQCYAEVSETKQNQSKTSKFFQGFAKGYNQSRQNTQQNNATRCYMDRATKDYICQ